MINDIFSQLERNIQKKLKEEKLAKKKDYYILIVDDDKWIHRVLSAYLQSWGFIVISAYDPYEAVSLALKYKPCLILLDIFLPEINGDKLLKLIKKIDTLINIPILIVSGNINRDLLGSTYKEGADGFISKPFTPAILLEKIKQVVSADIIINLDLENLAMSQSQQNTI